MGILKDTGETLIKFGEIIVNKTEEYAKIAKLNVEIKRFQIDQGIAEKELGRHVISKIENGAPTIEASDPKVKELHETVKTLKNKIEEKKAEIEKVRAEARAKMEAKSEKKPDSGAQ
jgi:hypothetical protein